MKKRKVIRLKKRDVGKWVRVWWQDVGCEDGIIVEVNNDGEPTFKYYDPRNRMIQTRAEFSQIDKLGPQANLEVPRF